MFMAAKNCLVFEHEGDRKQNLKTKVQWAKQQLARCALIAPKGRNEYIRIEHIGSSHT